MKTFTPSVVLGLRDCVSESLAMADEKSKLWGAATPMNSTWAMEPQNSSVVRRLARSPQGRDWIDIGCGTGQLSLQIANKCNPNHHIGIDTTEGFLTQAKKNVPSANFGRGMLKVSHLPNDAMDYAVSGLLLNFIPDKAKAVSEMVRIVRPRHCRPIRCGLRRADANHAVFSRCGATLLIQSHPLTMTVLTHLSADRRPFPTHFPQPVFHRWKQPR